MEGGYLPWKIQPETLTENIAEKSSKPLPALPKDHIWKRAQGGSWEICHVGQIENIIGPSTNQIEASLDVFEHIIMPDDTLQGICLNYRVSVVTLRRLNCFSGNNIQFKKSLVIPIDPNNKSIKYQENNSTVQLRKFCNETREGEMEARVYLENAGGSFDVALNAWKEDQEWEQSHYLSSLNKELNAKSPFDAAGLSRVAYASQFSHSTEMRTELSPVAIREPREVTPLCILENEWIAV